MPVSGMLQQVKNSTKTVSVEILAILKKRTRKCYSVLLANAPKGGTMNYDPVFDKWHEECGVFGVYDRTIDVATLCILGTLCTPTPWSRKRGHCRYRWSWCRTKKRHGLVDWGYQRITIFACHMGTGHVRYSTTGSNNPRNIQPLVIHYQGGQIASGP